MHFFFQSDKFSRGKQKLTMQKEPNFQYKSLPFLWFPCSGMRGVNQNADKGDAYHRPSGVCFFSPKKGAKSSMCASQVWTITSCDCIFHMIYNSLSFNLCCMCSRISIVVRLTPICPPPLCPDSTRRWWTSTTSCLLGQRKQLWGRRWWTG